MSLSYIESCRASESKLQSFIDDKNIDATLVIFNQSVHSTETSKEALGLGPESVLKSIVMKSDGFFVCVLRGSEKVDIKKLRILIGKKNIRTATPEEVLSLTGYIVGGVPPFGYSAKFYLDSLAVETLSGKTIHAGGGSPRALLKTSVEEIIKVNNPEIIAMSSSKDI